MMRYRSCLLLVMLVVALGAAESTVPVNPPSAKPNIIVILADDMGWGDVGIFFQNARRERGGAAIRTPTLDALARSGIMLTNHYCPAPVCAPSRASLLSGVHQGHASVRDNQFDKQLEDNHTLATVLKQAGYATAAIGKWGLQGEGPGPQWPAHPYNRGFDYYYGYIRHRDGHEHYPTETPHRNKGDSQLWDGRTNVVADLAKCYTTDLFTARAKHWIIDHQHATPDQPFFLYLAYDTPHATTELPTQAYPAGGGLLGGLTWIGTPGHMINTASGVIDSWIDPDYVDATWTHDGAQQPWPDVYKRYATSVRRIDDAVGDLLRLLADLSLDDNTLIVVTSDNGPSQESYLKQPLEANFFDSFGPFDGIKRDCWEGGLRVPTIARWRGTIPAGRISERPSALWDWLPTFAEIAHVPIPARSDGLSLLQDLTGSGTTMPDEPIYVEYQVAGRTPAYSVFQAPHRNRARNQMQAIRLGDYVGVRYDIKTHSDPFEIYQVRSDPQEAHDLGRDKPELQQRMHDLVLQMRRPDPEAPRPYDAEMVPAVPGPEGGPGLAWRFIPGAFPWVPKFPSTAAVAPLAATSGHDAVPGFPDGQTDHEGALCHTGFLRIPVQGSYTFRLSTDTGAVLRIHQATVIDADHGYQGPSPRSGTILLTAGLHPVTLTSIHHRLKDPLVTLSWSGANLPEQPIPASAFVRDADLVP